MATEKRLIDANELMQEIESKIYWGQANNVAVLEAIDDAPTVDAVEVVHGRWLENSVERNGELPIAMYECTECGGIIFRKKFNYCPNCGAKMDGERKDA